MSRYSKLTFALSLSAVALASCGNAEIGAETVENAAAEQGGQSFTVTPMGTFDEPWAIAFAPGTAMLFVTEKAGTIKVIDTATGKIGSVGGAPTVDYGGQGGMGDIAFLPAEADAPLDGRTVYLTWAEAGEGDVRGAALGRGTLACTGIEACAIAGLEVIWRQTPKVKGRGHYSHRITVSPDGQHLYVASGDRQTMAPAQETDNTLGSIVRLKLDGTPAAGNPFAGTGGAADEIWSYGHRNILGMDWDAQGRLWEVEHGPAGGDELNLVRREANYGWPVRSNGDHYNGDPIPDHAPDDGFAQPALSWNPVIAPGDMIIYSGAMFPRWDGRALIAGMSSMALVEVAIDGDQAREVARHRFDERVRSVEQGPDGAVWVAEDGKGGRVLKLSAR